MECTDLRGGGGEGVERGGGGTRRPSGCARGVIWGGVTTLSRKKKKEGRFVDQGIQAAAGE